MGNIFGVISRVLVWIGTAADFSGKTVELIDVLWTALKKARRYPSETQMLDALLKALAIRRHAIIPSP